MPRGSVAWTARRCGTGCTASMNGAPKGSRTAGRRATRRASRRSSWRSSPRSLKPARSAPCMESCAGAGWTCSRSWPSASASLTTSARSARSSSSSASRTSARVRAIRPRTRRPWRLLKKLRRDAEHSPRRPAEGQADRDLVPDAMRADTTGLNVQSGRRPQPNRGARHHAVREHRPHRHRAQLLVVARRRAPDRCQEVEAASNRRRRHGGAARTDRGAALARPDPTRRGRRGGVERELTELRTGDGRTLPPLLRAELDRLRRRLVLILELIRELEAERAAALAAAPDEAMAQKITSLQRVRGIGANFSAVLVREVLYRSFANRRQLASYVGVAPMPYQSGGMDRDRSISRAGNPRARTTLIQLAWLWLRYQPGSALATWFRERVGTLQGRTRRIAIVALARKLLIALWRYVEAGVLPAGVEIRTGTVPAA